MSAAFEGMLKCRVRLTNEIGRAFAKVEGYIDATTDRLAITASTGKRNSWVVTHRKGGYTVCRAVPFTARRAVALKRKLEPLADWNAIHDVLKAVKSAP